MEGICLLVTSLLLLLSLDQANFLLSHDSHPPPAPAFFSEKNLNARKVENFSERLASRQARIQEVCEKHYASLSWNDKRRERCMKMHIWDVVNHLVYCPIAKVASTTWFSNFLAWSKINRSSVPLVLDQLKEAGTLMKNEKAEAGGRGIRTLARCHKMTLNSNLEENHTGTSTRFQRPPTSRS